MTNCCVCDKPSAKKCGRCFVRNYCSTECQRGDWQAHKPNCKLPGAVEEYAIELIQKVLSQPLASAVGDEMSKKKHEWHVAVYPELRGSYAQEPTEEQKTVLTASLLKEANAGIDDVWRRDGQGLSRWQRPNLHLLCETGAPMTYSHRDVQRQAGSCHSYAAALVARGKRIGTGFGLFVRPDKRCWVPHSWEVENDKVVELTAQTYKRYWGMTLSDLQAAQFASMYSSDNVRQRILRSGILQDKASGLGSLYCQRGVQLSTDGDLKESFAFFQAGAALGHADSHHQLGSFYFQGLGDVTQNIEVAKMHFALAASQGLEASRCDLGACHYAYQDYEKAVECFQLAAAKGNAPAQYSLYICYSNGEGVSKDLDKANKFLRLAAQQGHPQALKLTRQTSKIPAREKKENLR